jgi:diaminopimelate decarboxylase
VAEPSAAAGLAATDVVGPICESGDSFARGRLLPPIEAGDLVTFAMAGAYGASMASNYNARPLAAEVMVRGDRFETVRPRQSLQDLFATERAPTWLTDPGFLELSGTGGDA